MTGRTGPGHRAGGGHRQASSRPHKGGPCRFPRSAKGVFAIQHPRRRNPPADRGRTLGPQSLHVAGRIGQRDESPRRHLAGGTSFLVGLFEPMGSMHLSTQIRSRLVGGNARASIDIIEPLGTQTTASSADPFVSTDARDRVRLAALRSHQHRTASPVPSVDEAFSLLFRRISSAGDVHREAKRVEGTTKDPKNGKDAKRDGQGAVGRVWRAWGEAVWWRGCVNSGGSFLGGVAG